MRGVGVGLGLLALAAACSFDESGIAFDGAAGPDASNGDGSTADGSAVPDGPRPDADLSDAACAWSYDPRYLDPCANDNPVPDLSIVLDEAGDYHFDTDTGVLITPSMGAWSPESSIIGDARALWFEGFAIDWDATLRVEGSRPLIIISFRDMAIFGTLDLSSHWDTNAFSVGAGSDPTACPTSPPDPGQICAQHGGSGGGAGAFGGNGGNGGEGGDTRDCGDGVHTDGIPGGAGGNGLGAPPVTVRGGCDGRAGAPNDSHPGEEGVGGPGGGAVHLTAQGTLLVGGTIHVGGAGGRPGMDDRAGGGGGGSGGFIGLEANTITVQATGVLASNGGGGGGGCNDDPASPGDDAMASSAVALGGPAQETGGNGGFGGYIVSSSGQNGSLAERGGGGGGGSVGFIALYSPNALNVHGSAIVSPNYVAP